MLKRSNYTKTPSFKDIERQVVVIDAKKKVLGRLATEIARHLQGKTKTNYVPNLDMGDYVVVINALKFKVTGRKNELKTYSRYSGYQGGLKTETLDSLRTRRPKEPIIRAVKGMLPDNKLKSQRLSRLFIFEDENYSLPKEVLAITEKKHGQAK